MHGMKIGEISHGKKFPTAPFSGVGKFYSGIFSPKPGFGQGGQGMARVENLYPGQVFVNRANGLIWVARVGRVIFYCPTNFRKNRKEREYIENREFTLPTLANLSQPVDFVTKKLARVKIWLPWPLGAKSKNGFFSDSCADVYPGHRRTPRKPPRSGMARSRVQHKPDRRGVNR